MPVKYTCQALVEAARTCSSYDEVVRHCGTEPTAGSRRYVRDRMTAPGIDTAHFTTARVRHTEEALRAAVALSTSMKEVVRRLGINPVGGNQAHIGRRGAALGIDTSHFVGREQRPQVRLMLGAPSGPGSYATRAEDRAHG
ncbi:hypothetical protein I5Q34_00805 [Streptomyces sp. AV19]|uniref:hypothetical protein n=1 Tax=Streptomyces sp. AV19 TaxID=2793068 RepID=UPI0018FE3290|nr:hypothetical protein [Streptomyces sp. AV19]MBH1932845.1 hypothetical protein [Streptomyces sp. AV19]